jgi:hypothetical protein
LSSFFFSQGLYYDLEEEDERCEQSWIAASSLLKSIRQSDKHSKLTNFPKANDPFSFIFGIHEVFLAFLFFVYLHVSCHFFSPCLERMGNR